MPLYGCICYALLHICAVIRVVSGLNNDVQFTIGGLRKACLQDPSVPGMKTGLVLNPSSNTIALNSTPGFIQLYCPATGGIVLEVMFVSQRVFLYGKNVLMCRS